MSLTKQKRVDLYSALMDEFKGRLSCINHASQGRTGFPPLVNREFIYLQVRMICEVVALSCLVAHGDISVLQPHKLGRSYSADDILERMSRLRAHFFPIPITREWLNPGAPLHKRHYQITAVDPSPLAKADLLALYGDTHRYLHRGSLKTLLAASASPAKPVDVSDLLQRAQKISDLLSHHLIAISEEQIMLCILANAETGGNVNVAICDKGELKLPS